MGYSNLKGMLHTNITVNRMGASVPTQKRVLGPSRLKSSFTCFVWANSRSRYSCVGGGGVSHKERGGHGFESQL